MIRVPREIIWWVLDKKWVLSRYIDIVKDMYDGAIASVRTTEERQMSLRS